MSLDPEIPLGICPKEIRNKCNNLHQNMFITFYNMSGKYPKCLTAENCHINDDKVRKMRI